MRKAIRSAARWLAATSRPSSARPAGSAPAQTLEPAPSWLGPLPRLQTTIIRQPTPGAQGPEGGARPAQAADTGSFVVVSADLASSIDSWRRGTVSPPRKAHPLGGLCSILLLVLSCATQPVWRSRASCKPASGNARRVASSHHRDACATCCESIQSCGRSTLDRKAAHRQRKRFRSLDSSQTPRPKAFQGKDLRGLGGAAAL